MQIEVNPYQPTSSPLVESKTAVPHTASIRAEAWRGFKFGARITGIVMSVIVVLVGLGMLGLTIYAVVVSNGAFLNYINYLQIARSIGGSVFVVLLMSFHGGVAGAIIMSLAAIIRKRRCLNTDSKTA
jgi:hypothetical protein